MPSDLHGDSGLYCQVHVDCRKRKARGSHEQDVDRGNKKAGSRSERTVIPADRPPKCVIKLQPLTNTLRCLKLDQEMSKREDKRLFLPKKEKVRDRERTSSEVLQNFGKMGWSR